MNYISLLDCIPRRVYKIQSRNLSFGIYDGDSGFIGIRTKFCNRYLFTEYHWDNENFATVKPIKDLGIDLPSDISLLLFLQTVDKDTNREVAFDRPVLNGGKGWYYLDTDESNQDICAISLPNNKLFKFLEEVEMGVW